MYFDFSNSIPTLYFRRQSIRAWLLQQSQHGRCAFAPLLETLTVTAFCHLSADLFWLRGLAMLHTGVSFLTIFTGPKPIGARKANLSPEVLPFAQEVALSEQVG